MKLNNRAELNEYRVKCEEGYSNEKCRILICGGTGCLAGGAGALYEKFSELVAQNPNIDVEIGDGIAAVKKSGCHGFCEMGPLVRIEPYNYLYLKVQLEDCEEIYHETVLKGRKIDRLLYQMDGVLYPSQEEIPFYAKQTRLVLKNCGHIDAEHIKDAVAVGAYKAIEKALFETTPEHIIQMITESGLRGSGGAGV